MFVFVSVVSVVYVVYVMYVTPYRMCCCTERLQRDCKEKFLIPHSSFHTGTGIHHTVHTIHTVLLTRYIHTVLLTRYHHHAFSHRYEGEEGIDAGGIAREWFDMLGRALTDPSIGLFTNGSDSTSGTALDINPSSAMANESHLEYVVFPW